MTSTHAEQFTELRPLLFTVAYEILGSATEADDVLQESYLRWAQVDPATVDNVRAYLAQIVTRQSLNALRALSRRREEYVGPWLPEPILIDATDPVGDGACRIRLHRNADRLGKPHPRQACGVRAAGGVRVRLRRDRRDRRQTRRNGPPDRAPRKGSRARPPAKFAPVDTAQATGWSTGSSPPPCPGTSNN